ncbi:ATP-dependent DNA ligase [Spirillospora sp. CA-255316]
MHIRSPITPMLAVTVDRLPSPAQCRGGCLFEPKFDGFRAVASVGAGRGAHLWSRRRTSLNEAFPEVVTALSERIPAGTVLDGEIVRWSAAGRLDFGALQRRHVAGGRRAELARTEPCHYVAFDVLETGGADLRPRPLRERRRALEGLLAGTPPGALVIACPQTADRAEAELWFAALAAQGIEGLVVKAAGDPYLPGRRRWWKIKHRTTVEVIVGGVTGSPEQPETLVLGRRAAGGRLRVVARTGPLPLPARTELGAVLRPAGDDHPWPAELPAGLAGGPYGGGPPLRYVRTVPDTVVEISVDAATEGGRWRHAARFVRTRPDRHPGDVPAGLATE